MKKVLLASASLFALSALAPASAADLAARPYTKAPIAVASIYNWSGFYLGINGGGASSRNCWDVNNIFGIAGPDTAEGCHNATGGVVGGQVGYRWQSANWVFGLEAQGDWANLKGSNTSVALGSAGQRDQDRRDWPVHRPSRLCLEQRALVREGWRGGHACQVQRLGVRRGPRQRKRDALGRRGRHRPRIRLRAELVRCDRIRPSFHGQAQQLVHDFSASTTASTVSSRTSIWALFA